MLRLYICVDCGSPFGFSGAFWIKDGKPCEPCQFCKKLCEESVVQPGSTLDRQQIEHDAKGRQSDFKLPRQRGG